MPGFLRIMLHMECRAIVLAREPSCSASATECHARESAWIQIARGALNHVLPFTRENVHVLRYRVLKFAREYTRVRSMRSLSVCPSSNYGGVQ